jgi:acetylornithine deacetylase/succinyl-diaminopimelate desuccinylase-like protein
MVGSKNRVEVAKMSIERAYEYIDVHTDDFIRNLVRLVRQPSVSAKNEGMRECAELAERMMREAGLSAKILSEEKGNPVVYGEIRSKKSHRTLLFYDHYDVQPPEPFEKWTHEPFGGEIQNGKSLWKRCVRQ